MIEFKPKDTDLILEKRPRWPDIHNNLEEVRSIVFKDEKGNINDFLEFDSLYHFIDTIEQQYENKGLRKILLDDRSGPNDDFCYSSGSSGTKRDIRWTYGTQFFNRRSHIK